MLTQDKIQQAEQAARDADAIPESDIALHTHIDGCHQCMNHPWELCPVGVKLLIEAGRHDK